MMYQIRVLRDHFSDEEINNWYIVDSIQYIVEKLYKLVTYI